jgi:diketogulonate reductase-like aldo/keto reductase
MPPHPLTLSRRAVLGSLVAAGATSLAPFSIGATEPSSILTKPIPATGEALPIVGMGSWKTFNVGGDPEARDARTEVLRAFFAAGGGLVDSSPMYASSEEVIGHVLGKLDMPPGLFSATKVWTSDGEDGPPEIEESRRLWGVDRFDLLQVHNLVAWEPHLETLFAMKAAGRLRYVGITTSHGRRHEDFEVVMASQPIDFVQFTYNVRNREVERRLLPLAAEKGIAVIVNRPFERRALIDDFEDKPLPAWAREIDCANWPQFLLKFIVSHPAVTCAIPATSRVDHMQENMAAAQGRLPDAATRGRMLGYIEDL